MTKSIHTLLLKASVVTLVVAVAGCSNGKQETKQQTVTQVQSGYQNVKKANNPVRDNRGVTAPFYPTVPQ